SNALDVQWAVETTNTLWATMIGGCDLVMHAAGWLEGGVTASYEKFVLDLELLRGFDVLAVGIGMSEEEFAMDAVRQEGPGGMFLPSDHTLAHFKDWVF